MASVDSKTDLDTFNHDPKLIILVCWRRRLWPLLHAEPGANDGVNDILPFSSEQVICPG